MSIVHKSIIHSGPVFLKAITAWSSGDFTNTQILCLQCLEGLRYNPSFPHLAACLYFLAFCVKDDKRTAYADDVIECLQNKCSTKDLQFNLPWPLLESFNGTSKSFFELVNRSSSNGVGGDDSPTSASLWNDLNGAGDGEIYADGEYLVAPPAWYHHSYNRLTAENYESLALFCLDMGLRELGVAFAVRAHQESRRRESPDLCSSDSGTRTPSPVLTNGDTLPSSFPSSPSPNLDTPSSPEHLPSLSLSLLRHLNLPVSLRPDEDGPILEDTDMVFSVRTSQNRRRSQKKISDSQLYDSVTKIRRRIHGSILKPPSLFFFTADDGDVTSHSQGLLNGDSGNLSRCDSTSSVDPQSPKKRVRFSLSASHPPPHLEAQFGGRSNSQRLQDMARRRSYNYHRRGDLDSDDDGIGAFDRLVGIFWPDGGRFRWFLREDDAGVPLEDITFRQLARCAGEVAAFLICLMALLMFCLLFLALVVCIPLTWFTLDGNAGVTAGTCVRLLNAFGLQALLAR